VAAVVDHVDNMTGLKRTYDAPPDSINLFPAAVVYARSAQMGERIGKGVCDASIITVVVEVHHSRQILPAAVAASLVWPDLLFAELQASTTLDVMYPLNWTAGLLKYAAEDHYGIRFEIQVRD
jgi:hypothetical protein